MTKNPTVVSPYTTIGEIKKIFSRKKFWSIYIGTSNNFIGVITRNDLRNRGESLPLSTPVYEIMSHGVISIDENTDVDEAQKILLARKINGLAVTRNGNHVGILTRYDIKKKKFNFAYSRAPLMVLVIFIGVTALLIASGYSIRLPSITQSSSGELPISATPIVTFVPTVIPPKIITTATPPVKPQITQASTNPISVSSPTLDVSSLEKRVHELINTQRNSNGLSSLRLDPALAAIARAHSQDMAKNNYFSHINLQGLDPSARGNQQGYSCRKDYGSYYTYGIAENIFETNHWTTYNGVRVNDFESLENIAQQTVNGWMDSPGHRKNILTSTYDREGIGIGISSDNTVYITEDFC